MCEKLMKNVDIEEPTSFLDHVNLECTQHECEQNDKIIEKIQICSNHVFLLEQRKIAGMGKHKDQKFLRDPTMWKHMHENAWNGTSNWPTKHRAIP